MPRRASFRGKNGSGGPNRHSLEGFALSLTARGEAEAERLFSALAEGGQVQMPLAKTSFSPSFGMVADRFGAPRMIYVEPEGRIPS